MEAEKFWTGVNARYTEMAQAKQRLEYSLLQRRLFSERITSRFQNHLNNSNPSPHDRLKEVSEEVFGRFKGINQEVASEDQVAFLERMRNLDFNIFERQMEFLTKTYFKLDLEYDYALKYHKFLNSLHQHSKLEARLGPQGTPQGLLDADNSFLQAQKLLKMEPKFQ
jgi:hypothetical protein